MTAPRAFFAAAAVAASLALSLPVMAEDHPAQIHVNDAYARAAGIGKSGAIFFTMHNMTETDDRLVDVRAEVAQRVELHSHVDMGDGVMKMMHMADGLPLAAGEAHALARGGDHVMLMGLTADLKNGDRFPLTLVFEQAGDITIDVTVDNDRQDPPAAMNHGAHGQGAGG